MAGARPDGEAGEWRCRVYGHRLNDAAPEIGGAHRWLAAADLEAVTLEDGASVRKWLRMWQEQEDEEGRAVTRSFGLPTTDVEYYNYNGGGNPQGTYRIGVFDSEGRPPCPPTKLAERV